MTHKCKTVFSSVAPVAFPVLPIAVSPRVSSCNCMHKKRGRRLLSKRWIAFITNWAFRRSQEDWGGNDWWWDYRCSVFSGIPLSVLNGGYWSISESSAFQGERAVTRQWRNAYWPDVNNFCEGFPDGPVVKNFPCNARNTGSVPGLGRLHMPRSNLACVPQLLNPCAANTEAWMHLSLCSAAREGTTVGSPCTTMKSSPCSWQLERAWVQQRRPSTTKKKKKTNPFDILPTSPLPISDHCVCRHCQSWPHILLISSEIIPGSLREDLLGLCWPGILKPTLTGLGDALGIDIYFDPKGRRDEAPGSLTTNKALDKCRY